MDGIDGIIAGLASESTDGYGNQRIPCAIDATVRALLQAISSESEVAQSQIIAQLRERHGFVLTAFAERMAAYAVRTGDGKYIDEGLSALALASRVLDVREAILVLSLLYASAERIGLDARAVFRLSALADSEFQSVVAVSANRSDDDRSLEAMGYSEGHDQDGFRYYRCW